MNNKIKVDREILFFAFKYLIGKSSYAPDIIIKNIKNNINNINTNYIELYIKEINEYQKYGMHTDEQSWLNFKDDLESELEKRNKYENG
jgi:hypothetical protein